MAWLNVLLTVGLIVGIEFWFARWIERNAPMEDEL